MVQVLKENWRCGANRFVLPGEALFEARVQDRLAGLCGLNRDPYLRDGGTGRVRHLYVLPESRSHGVGRSLVENVVHHAHSEFSRLRLRTDSPEAARFYEAIGFSPVVETEGTHELLTPLSGSA